MRYFILYVFNQNMTIREFYFKSRSFVQLEDRIRYYSDGCIFTSKFAIDCDNIFLGFLREIDLEFHPELKKTDFAMINESESYSAKEFDDKKF